MARTARKVKCISESSNAGKGETLVCSGTKSEAPKRRHLVTIKHIRSPIQGFRYRLSDSVKITRMSHLVQAHPVFAGSTQLKRRGLSSATKVLNRQTRSLEFVRVGYQSRLSYPRHIGKMPDVNGVRSPGYSVRSAYNRDRAIFNKPHPISLSRYGQGS